MSLSTNVVRRPGSAMYYARIGIPPDLQRFYPSKGGKQAHRRELWRSLGTRDPKAARDLVLPVLSEWRREFAALRARRAPGATDIQAGAWAHYERELTLDERQRANMPTTDKIEAARHQPHLPGFDLLVMRNAARNGRENRAIQLRTLREHLASGETALIHWAADDLIEREKLLVEKGSPKYREICNRLQRAQVEALERAAERDAGDWAGVPKDPDVRPPDPTMGKQFAAPGETIMELYDRFKAERLGTARPDTWNQNRKIVKLFAEYVGETSHVSVITRKTVRNWKHELSGWPVKAGEIAAFKGMSFRKIIEANASIKKPTISDKTKNKYLSAVGSFSTWLLQNEFIEADVMAGMYLVLDKRKKVRLPFTADQLKTIFNSPLFTTCMGDDREHEPGNVAIRDWRYWIGWIGLYTGARLGEIAQMATADLFQIHDVWVFHITEDGEVDDDGSPVKSAKTRGSQRVVPVHSELIKLGLLEYHTAMIARGEKQLFPEIKPDTRGFFSGVPSTFFNDYFRAIGVKVDRKVNFHSFRHGIADAFRAAGYMDEQFNVLLGHTKATTTGKYGILPQGILSQRVEMIEAVRFEF
ncbi:site-specific integrase [Bradyrhizobium sp. CER78]|uniref:site-specific integrase n=1 Tax=Bradyrhizobium sp. CER78 TaxID=3039162 RepID=UPI002447CCAC|nr:site-specific integrase [Bradyrhizobium sp. CER78]MDH2384818.1 site-specific integrase [Bradyrhizobium sp. CER78]